MSQWRVNLGRVAVWLSFASILSSVLLVVLSADGWVVVPAVTAVMGFVLSLFAVSSKPSHVTAAGMTSAAAGPAAMVLVFAIFWLPGMLRPCCGSPEASAIGSLRSINSAQAAYSSSCAAGGYAVDLADLVKAPQGVSQGFISPELNHNGVIKSDYIITLTRDASSGVTDVGSAAATCNQATKQPVSSYFASANPVKPGVSETRYFATDARGTIFYSLEGPIPNPIPPDAPVVQ